MSAIQTKRLVGSSAVSMIGSLATVLAAPAAFGDAPPATPILTLIVENDDPSGNDRHYSSGMALVWVPARDSTAEWAQRLARQLPWYSGEGQVRDGYAIGQNLYTPSDLSLANPPLDDRPYAGWLYGSVALAIETGPQLDQLSLTLGVVGPASLAGQAQKLGHEITGNAKPQGWDTQLDNEPGIVLTYQRSWRALAATTRLGIDADLTPHFGAALGNVYTYANGGLTLRYGQDLQLDYGPPRIQPGVQGSAFFVPAGGFAWYLFAGFEGRAVVRNIFLDGNTFRDSRSVDKAPLVRDLQYGIVLRWRDVRMSYTHVERSREFRTQDEPDEFGSLSISVDF